MPTKEGFMTPKEVEDMCNGILDSHGIPRDFKPDDEEVKRVLSNFTNFLSKALEDYREDKKRSSTSSDV
jgi:hypothetical protein